MGVDTKPQDDAKAMTAEYIKGASIADLALKYNHDAQDVEAIVTNPPAEEPVVTQAQEDTQPVEESKKAK